MLLFRYFHRTKVRPPDTFDSPTWMLLSQIRIGGAAIALCDEFDMVRCMRHALCTAQDPWRRGPVIFCIPFVSCGATSHKKKQFWHMTRTRTRKIGNKFKRRG